MGETLLAAETGDALPPGAAFGTDGNPTVDGASYLIFPWLGDIAVFERDLIRACTSEAPESSNARGVKLRRKPRLPEHQKREMILRRGAPLRDISDTYNVSQGTISRLLAALANLFRRQAVMTYEISCLTLWHVTVSRGDFHTRVRRNYRAILSKRRRPHPL
jgi:hypothetical protein